MGKDAQAQALRMLTMLAIAASPNLYNDALDESNEERRRDRQDSLRNPVKKKYDKEAAARLRAERAERKAANHRKRYNLR